MSSLIGRVYTQNYPCFCYFRIFLRSPVYCRRDGTLILMVIGFKSSLSNHWNHIFLHCVPWKRWLPGIVILDVPVTYITRSKFITMFADGLNSLAPGRFKFRLEIFKPILVNDGWGISYEIALRRMPQDLTDGKSTLVQVMASCRQATSHYLSQFWPRSMSSNGITRPQWVDMVRPERNGCHYADIFKWLFLN